MNFERFESDGCKGSVAYNVEAGEANISGVLKNPETDKVKSHYTFEYLAASPPDTRYSRAGSGLPFPNKEIAFSNTPNKGTVTTDKTGNFNFTVQIPNQYYVNGGKDLQEPTVFIIDSENNSLYSIIMEGVAVPSRSLTNIHGRPRRTTGR